MPNDNNQNQNPALANDDKTSSTPIDPKPPVIVDEGVLPPMPQINEKMEQTTETGQDIINSSPANSGSAAPSDDVVTPSVVGMVPPPAKKFAGGKIIATILGLFLLVGGVGAGVLLTGQNQNPQEKAYSADCNDNDGDGKLEGPGCSECELMQWCSGPGGGCSQEWGGCQDNPNFQLIARCDSVKAYSSSWEPLSNNDLSKLKAGDQVNFCAVGFTNVPLPFNAARFTINGTLRPETTATRPGGVPNEFCDLYTIPEGVTTFNVSAEVRLRTRWR